MGRPQEPEEEEKRRSVATPVKTMTRTEKQPPTHIAMHGQSNKNTLVNTEKELSDTHTKNPAVGHLVWTFDLR